MFHRCPYCHRRILSWKYEAHVEEHTRLRDDGQMNEHVTAPPEDRFAGSLDDVPQHYRHLKCGEVTKMPEDIVRTYLADPLTYGDGTFCAGCSCYVDIVECVWAETGENLLAYRAQARMAYLRTTLNMVLPDRPTGITITPHAILKVKKIFRQAGRTPLLSLDITKHAGNSTMYKLDVVTHPDRETQVVITSSGGINIAIPKLGMAAVQGLLIHYHEQQNGFTISRLYVPSGAVR